MKKLVLGLVALSGNLLFAQNINMSNGSTNTCSANFYDSGGLASNYGNNENLSHTFFPASAGTFIELTFTSYVSGPADQIAIYDGPDNTYPMLFMDGGNLTIPTFVSTDITGALTVEFNSNGSGNQAGWVAVVSCCASPQAWFPDADGDGFGSMWDLVFSCTAPPGYITNGDDCDDNAVLYEDLDGDGFGNPLVTVGCGVNDDTDCNDNLLTYEDLDGDTYGNPNAYAACGVTNTNDCDDTDAGVGAGTMLVFYADMDGDGYGDPWNIAMACSVPLGYVTNNDDCDDFSILYEDLDGDGFGNPAIESACGSFDNTDCDDTQWTYADNDGDNFGDPNIAEPCGITDNTDCDDTDAGVGGGVMTAYYSDNDGDGFGDPWNYLFSCSAPVGYVTDSSDCDDWTIMYPDNDGDGFGVPGAPVACGAYDNTDCNDNLITYEDMDGDTYGNPNTMAPCGVADNTDCDDDDPGVGSGTMTAYYQDWDGDNYGSQFWPFYSCGPVFGMVTNNTDCDDFDPNVNPGETEINGNGIDDNCDGYQDPTAELEETVWSDFILYPNPAENLVNVQFQSEENINVELYTISGQLVAQKIGVQGESKVSFDLTDLDSGVYFVLLSAPGKFETLKLIVQ
jgi:hypothetical protein